jgi:glycosyltransferase involved in cell wall biosynthesis
VPPTGRRRPPKPAEPPQAASLRVSASPRPRVSVVIPVYNQERYVGECVQSALDQTYQDREVVVVDDGSTDRTPDRLAAFGDQIRSIRQPNAGFAAALNHGIAQSRGQYLAWLSSDDLFLPPKLERQVAYLDTHPEVDLVYTDFYEIDPAGQVIRAVRSPWYPDRRQFVRQMLWNNFVNGSSVLMRRTAVAAVGGFPTSPRFQADGIMWFAMLAGGAFGHVPEPLTRYRIHPGQGSRDVARLQRDMELYYRRALSVFTLEELFGDLAQIPTWRADAHRELGDILAYRHLAGLALPHYLRAASLGAPISSTALRVLRALARSARRRLRVPSPSGRGLEPALSAAKG